MWSPRKGYPGGRWYRDFHTFDHASGFRPVARHEHHDAAAREGAVRARIAQPRRSRADAADFVDVVRRRLVDLADAARRATRPGRRRRTTPSCSGTGGTRARSGSRRCCGPPRGRRARDDAAPARSRPGTSAVRSTSAPGRGARARTGGCGTAQAVADLVADNERAARPGRARCSQSPRRTATRRATSSRATTLLALASDWAFMVTKDSAAGYARDRHDRHHREARMLADLSSAVTTPARTRSPSGCATSTDPSATSTHACSRAGG